MSSPQAIFLPELPKPPVVEELDYESTLQGIKQQFNALQPNLIDEKGKAVILPADLIQTTNGEVFWKIPVNQEMGLFYLDLESEPITRLLEIAAYRELLLRQRVNEAALAVMAAYANGSDQDELYKLWGLERLIIKEETDDSPAVLESDEAYRRRYGLSLDQFTTAGSEESYLFHALSASGLVKDASAHSPDAVEVVITVLSHEENTGLASWELVSIIYDYVSGRRLRPLADEVTVQAASIVEYELVLNVVFEYGPSPEPVIAQIERNLAAFVEKQHRLRADIELTALAAQCHLAGVHRIEFLTELPIRCDATQAPYCTNIDIRYGGRDD